VNTKVVSYNSSLAELGMNSMAVEIKQTLEREFDILLTAQEILSFIFTKLIKMSDTNVSDDNNIHDKRELDTKDPYIINLPIGVVKEENFISQTCFDLCTKRQKTNSNISYTGYRWV